MRRDRVGFVAGFAFAAALMGWLGTAAFADATVAGAPACCSDAAAKCGTDGAECCKGEGAKCGEAGKCCHQADGKAAACQAGCCKHEREEAPKASCANGCCKKQKDPDASTDR